MKIVKILLFSFIFLFIISFSFLFFTYKNFVKFKVAEKTFITIKKGENILSIAKNLEEKKIISSNIFFAFILKYKKLTVKSGTYLFLPQTKIDMVINKLVKGDVYYYKITIPEGFTLKQIAQKLKDEGVILATQKFLKLARPQNFKTKFIPFNIKTLEGFIFPSTYFITANKNEKEIISLMLNTFYKQLQKLEIEKHSKRLKLTPYKIIILASLVEKEAKLDKERYLIASVLYKRIKKKMFLQCDATIQYTLKNHKQKLSFNDLKIKSSYNTYIFKGLPLTPICNPGIKSIKAVLNIGDTPFLYYVAKPDGSHFFSQSFAQHRIAKKNTKAMWNK